MEQENLIFTKYHFHFTIFTICYKRIDKYHPLNEQYSRFFYLFLLFYNSSPSSTFFNLQVVGRSATLTPNHTRNSRVKWPYMEIDTSFIYKNRMKSGRRSDDAPCILSANAKQMKRNIDWFCIFNVLHIHI